MTYEPKRHTLRYIVSNRTAELVGDKTAQRHRLLVIGADESVTVRASHGGQVLAAMSRAEFRLLMREYRREMLRRFGRRLAGALSGK